MRVQGAGLGGQNASYGVWQNVKGNREVPAHFINPSATYFIDNNIQKSRPLPVQLKSAARCRPIQNQQSHLDSRCADEVLPTISRNNYRKGRENYNSRSTIASLASPPHRTIRPHFYESNFLNSRKFEGYDDGVESTRVPLKISIHPPHDNGREWLVDSPVSRASSESGGEPKKNPIQNNPRAQLNKCIELLQSGAIVLENSSVDDIFERVSAECNFSDENKELFKKALNKRALTQPRLLRILEIFRDAPNMDNPVKPTLLNKVKLFFLRTRNDWEYKKMIFAQKGFGVSR